MATLQNSTLCHNCLFKGCHVDCWEGAWEIDVRGSLWKRIFGKHGNWMSMTLSLSFHDCFWTLLRWSFCLSNCDHWFYGFHRLALQRHPKTIKQRMSSNCKHSGTMCVCRESRLTSGRANETSCITASTLVLPSCSAPLNISPSSCLSGIFRDLPPPAPSGES